MCPCFSSAVHVVVAICGQAVMQAGAVLTWVARGGRQVEQMQLQAREHAQTREEREQDLQKLLSKKEAEMAVLEQRLAGAASQDAQTPSEVAAEAARQVDEAQRAKDRAVAELQQQRLQRQQAEDQYNGELQKLRQELENVRRAAEEADRRAQQVSGSRDSAALELSSLREEVAAANVKVQGGKILGCRQMELRALSVSTVVCLSRHGARLVSSI